MTSAAKLIAATLWLVLLGFVLYQQLKLLDMPATDVKQIKFNGMAYLLWPNGHVTPDVAAEREFDLRTQAATAEFFMRQLQQPTPAVP